MSAGGTAELIGVAHAASSLSPSKQVASAVAQALAKAGTRWLFGVPGGGPNLDVIGASADVGIAFVLTHGETAAVIMAATTSELTGAPGAMVATRGPGLASAINGIAHAALDHLSVLAIVDTVSVAERGRIGHQRIDQLGLGSSVAKASIAIGARHADEAAAAALRLADSEPKGPVVLNLDPAAGDATPLLLAEIDLSGDLRPLERALGAARRPVVVVGADAIEHTEAVRDAILGSGIPVLHTYRTRGLIPDSATEAGGLITGGTMEYPLLHQADLLVGLGVDPTELLPLSWEHVMPAVFVSEVPSDATSYFASATEILAPLAAGIELLKRRTASSHDWPEAAGRTAKEIAAALLMDAPEPQTGRLTPQTVVSTVHSVVPSTTTVTVDAGAHMLAVMPLWSVEGPRQLLISSGLATMGYAVPAGIAAALCRPDSAVVAFTGDGGLGMDLMEIETAVREQLRVIVVVFNDATLSLIKIKQQPDGQGGEGAVNYRDVDFAAAAAALGAVGERVASVETLTQAVTRALERRGPSVIDVAVDPADYPTIMELSRGQAGRDSARP